MSFSSSEVRLANRTDFKALNDFVWMYDMEPKPRYDDASVGNTPKLAKWRKQIERWILLHPTKLMELPTPKDDDYAELLGDITGVPVPEGEDPEPGEERKKLWHPFDWRGGPGRTTRRTSGRRTAHYYF